MLEIRIDPAGIERIANLLAAAGPKAPHAIRRAVNHTGDKARTRMVRTLTAQTGLKRRVIVKALKVRRANFQFAAYAIESAGGNIALKFFGARETRKGVSAAPWGKRRIFVSTFIKGGRFPGRVALKMGGHVFERTGEVTRTGRPAIRISKSGVIIPNEMVAGATRQAFYAVVGESLPGRLSHELYRIIGAT